MSLDKVFRPFASDKHGSHLQEGFIMGWIPGIITSLDDPEKLNRVQCSCPIIDPSLNIPNIDGQWCWRTARFTLSGIKGGSVDPLYVGLQVVLIPMFGDLRYLAVFDCLYSRIDQPPEQLDVSKQIYGSVSLHEVMNIHNDREESTVVAYPHGVVKTVSGTGDIINQTKQKALSILKEDGTILVQNPKSSMNLDPQGEISHHVASGARSIFQKNGEVRVFNSKKGKLELLHRRSKVIGPRGGLGGFLGGAKGLGGMFSRITNVVNKFASLDLGNMVSAVAEGAMIYAELSTGVGSFSGAFSALKGLNALPLKDFVLSTQPQITSILSGNIPKIARDITQVVSQSKDPFAIARGAIGIAESAGVNLGNLNDVVGFVESMSNSPQKLIESFASNFVEDGFKSISQVVGMDLLTNLDLANDKLAQISDLLKHTTFSDSGMDESRRQSFIEGALSEIKRIIPWGVSDQEIFASAESDNPVATLLAYHEKQEVQKAVNAATEFEPLLDLVMNTKGIFDGIRDENYYQVFRSVEQIKEQEPSFASVRLGDYSISDWGNIEPEEATLGDLLGEINPHTFNLDVAVEKLISVLDLGSVNLQSAGINEIVNVSDLLSMVDLGSFDLSGLMQDIESSQVELSDLKLKDILGKVTVSLIQDVKVDSIKLSDIFKFRDNVDTINVKDFIFNESSGIQNVSLKDIYPDADDVRLSDFLNSYDFGGVNPKEFTFTQVSGINPDEIDPSTINIPMNVGKVTDEQTRELWQRNITGLMDKFNNSSMEGLKTIDRIDRVIPSGDERSRMDLSSNSGEMSSNWGNSRLFVRDGGIGASTPGAGFDIGDDGGIFFARTNLIIAAIERFNRYAAGLFLSPRYGLVISESPRYDYKKPEEWDFSRAKVQIFQGNIKITADDESNKILVNRDEILVSSDNAQIKVSQREQVAEISLNQSKIEVNNNEISITNGIAQIRVSGNQVFVNGGDVFINGNSMVNLINNYNTLLANYQSILGSIALLQGQINSLSQSA